MKTNYNTSIYFQSEEEQGIIKKLIQIIRFDEDCKHRVINFINSFGIKEQD